MLSPKLRLTMEASARYGIEDTNYVVQTSYKDDDLKMRILISLPIISRLFIKQAIKEGRIYLRPYKVDPLKPEFYWVKGWQVRNLSQRKDGVYYENAAVSLVSKKPGHK